ncbi:hypothetical protein HZA40_02880 [Candidatus Peregrinibacteria bacterium]|nr:hypothetical protein [Candidatus Peregrinibacteria bacterium]
MDIIEKYKQCRKVGKALNKKILSLTPEARDCLLDAAGELGAAYYKYENKRTIILEHENEADFI